MPKIEAIEDVPFGVGIQPKGSQFEATDQEAELLIALKRAKPVSKAKAVEPETREMKPEEEPTKRAKKAAKVTKRTYSRRDMKAKG